MRYKLTIIVDDTHAESGVLPLTTAVSNLEYDGYEIISSDEIRLEE